MLHNRLRPGCKVGSHGLPSFCQTYSHPLIKGVFMSLDQKLIIVKCTLRMKPFDLLELQPLTQQLMNIYQKVTHVCVGGLTWPGLTSVNDGPPT